MRLRDQLRELIDVLECRWEHLSDDSTSFSQDIASLLRSDDIHMLRQASDTHRTLCETLLSVHVVMRDERDALLHRERLVQNWQQPAVRLPFEVLELIFEMACMAAVREEKESEWAREYHCTRNAINLTCCHWREVALKATGLWSHIFVCNRSQPEAVARGPESDLMITELERAGGRPLAFYFYKSANIDVESVNEQWNLAFDIVRAELHRGLVYHAALQPFMPFDTSSIPLSLPSLRTFVLTLDHYRHNFRPESDVPIQPVLIDLTDAPSLQNLWLRYHGTYDMPCLSFRVPQTCSAVTELHVSQDIDYHSIIEAINGSPRLETLELDGCGLAPDGKPLIFEPLPYLINLSIDIGHAFAVDRVPALSAPNLVRLRVECEYVKMSISDTCKHIFAFRFPALRYLEVFGDDSSLWQVLPPFIASHSNLEEVTVDLGHPLNEESCDSLSKFPMHHFHPLCFTVWMAVKLERAPNGDYTPDTQLLRKLLLAHVDIATSNSLRPSTFVVKVDPNRTIHRFKDISARPEVVDLMQQYCHGQVLFELKEHVADKIWLWEWAF